MGNRSGRSGIEPDDPRLELYPNHGTACHITNLTGCANGLRIVNLFYLNQLFDRGDANLSAAGKVVRDVISPGSKMTAFRMTYFLGFCMCPLLVTFPELAPVVEACVRFVTKFMDEEGNLKNDIFLAAHMEDYDVNTVSITAMALAVYGIHLAYKEFDARWREFTLTEDEKPKPGDIAHDNMIAVRDIMLSSLRMVKESAKAGDKTSADKITGMRNMLMSMVN